MLADLAAVLDGSDGGRTEAAYGRTFHQFPVAPVRPSNVIDFSAQSRQEARQ